MKYLCYHPKETNATLIGTERESILKTLRHYALPAPTNGQIRQLAGVKVICSLGIPITEHFFQAEVRKRVLFQVHANAFNYIKEISEGYEALRRGGLYKFDPGRREYGLLFLPEYIMSGLRAYDWDRFRSRVDEWMMHEQQVHPEMTQTRQFFAKQS
jgi:hypothetical protein